MGPACTDACTSCCVPFTLPFVVASIIATQATMMVVAALNGGNTRPAELRRGRLISSRRRITITALLVPMYLSCPLLCDAFTFPVNSVRITPGDSQNTHRKISHETPREIARTITYSSSSKSKYNTNHNRQGPKKKGPLLQQKLQQQAPPIFLFPWSILLKIRSALPPDNNKNASSSKSTKKQRRWEMPLTSKPFQGVEELQSTVEHCLLALATYFAIGTCVFPLLEPSWTYIDALYFSMTTLTTVAYGDVVVSNGGTFGKLFLMSFNVYAVCISVSALGIIGKLAWAQEKKIIKQARQKARARLVRLFRDEEESEDEEEDDPEDSTWVDNIYLDKYGDDSEVPQTMMGALWQSLQRHAFNFAALIGLASILGKVEKWSLVDVIYFWNCTATTMGFGDVAPQTQIGRLLAVVFIPLSVITLGEVIASCVAHINARAAAKAEKDFLRREITFDDLDHLDVNDDGKVCQLDFITFMLLAMQKVDRRTMKDLTSLFKALDAGKTGFIEKEDLILLRQRKRLAKRLRREARHRKKLYEKGYPRIEVGKTQTSKRVYDHLEGYRIN